MDHRHAHAGDRVLGRCIHVLDRQERARPHAAGRDRDQHRHARGRLARLRPALSYLRTTAGAAVDRGRRVLAVRGLGIVPRLRRARSVHSRRFDHRHDHGRERRPRHHPRAAPHARADSRRTGARSAAGPAREDALGPQHVSHASGAVHHDQQPLPDDLQRVERLDRARVHQRRRRAGAAVLRRCRTSAATSSACPSPRRCCSASSRSRSRRARTPPIGTPRRRRTPR